MCRAPTGLVIVALLLAPGCASGTASVQADAGRRATDDAGGGRDASTPLDATSPATDASTGDASSLRDARGSPEGGPAALADATRDGAVASLDSGDVGLTPDATIPACGTSLGSTAPRPSSFTSCGAGSFACDFGEACDATVYDLLCPSLPCTPPPQTGDLRCHRLCASGGCAPGERCEPRPVYVSDTPTRYLDLCVCDGDAASCAPVDPASRGPEGGIASFEPRAPLLRDLYYHSMAATSSWLVVSGGLTITTLQATSATLAPLDTVSATPIAASGALGAWRDIGHLAAPRTNHAMVFVGDRLYVAGGTVGSAFTSSVVSAPLAPDGTLGPFRDEAPLPAGRAWHTLLSDGTTLVVAAGSLSAPYFTEGTTEIWTATPASDGVVSSWATAAAPVPVHYDGGAVLADGVLYLTGQQGGMWWKPLAALGDGSPWSQATEPLGAHVDFASSGEHTLRVAPLCDLLLFLVPGGRAATVERSPGGSLGAWHVASRISGVGVGFAIATSAVSGGSPATARGRVYVSGGTSGGFPIERVTGVWSTER